MLRDRNRLRRTLSLAARNLSRTRTRSTLATVGLVVGVLAIATFGAFGTALGQQADARLDAIGGQVAVGPGPASDGPALTDADVAALERVADGTVVPVRERQATVRYGRTAQPLVVSGVPDPAAHYEASRGEVPASLGGAALVAPSAAARLGVGPGDGVTVGDRTYRVVAVLEPQVDRGPIGAQGVVVPAGHFEDAGYARAVVLAADDGAANRTATAIEGRYNDRGRRFVVSQHDYRESVAAFHEGLGRWLLGVAAAALLVGAVAVLADRLLGIEERRRRSAVLGPDDGERDAGTVVLAEALLVGAAGALAGLVLALFVGAVVGLALLGEMGSILLPRNLLFLALAALAGVGTSLLAGLYPAWKARVVAAGGT